MAERSIDRTCFLSLRIALATETTIKVVVDTLAAHTSNPTCHVVVDAVFANLPDAAFNIIVYTCITDLTETTI
ncbi:hypothetical protein [Parapedobacter pyrenivorans]|uniref:hypothetical protein n=1 Tax=Parapedobacter pyrenivorans TaxID=1305674 RepID=UPI00333EA994